MKDINNDLKRTRKKLEVMNTPNINWVLHDLIDEVDFLINESYSATPQQRMWIITNLKKSYQKIIKELEEKDPTQIELDL